MSNKSQTIWTAASFLILGLIIGLLVTGPRLLSSSDGTGTEESESAELQIVAASVDEDAVLGSPDAPVTIIEFSDYQCPWCEYWWKNTYPQLKSTYIDTGKVKLVYRDRPVSTHPQSQLAAEAAECVGSMADDAAYYEMHDKLFAGTVDWSYQENHKDVFVNYGKELGVDITSCLDQGTMKEEVANDYAASRTYGVRGTPSFFINGKMVVGAQDFEYFKTIIEAELN